MPQLDIGIHFSQIFFTLIIFIYFYSNLIQWVIPFINTSLKIRKKKIKYSLLNQININIVFNLIYFFKNIKTGNLFNFFIKKLNLYINYLSIFKQFNVNLNDIVTLNIKYFSKLLKVTVK